MNIVTENMENDVIKITHDQILAKKRAYYQANRERILLRNRMYIQRKKEYDSNYQKRNRHSVALRNRKYRLRLKQKIYDILGGICSSPTCLIPGGCTDIRCLQLDHINGGGKREMKLYGCSTGMIMAYAKLTPEEIKKKLQILCANCNWIKVHENKERVCKYF